MTRIAFFGHDAADAAVRRRVQGFRDDGLAVTGFMMRRRSDLDIPWDNVDLGLTFDGAYRQRIQSIFRGARLAAADPRLAEADLVYARNLDMLATAFLAKRHAGLKTPVVYECLDVHRLLTRNDPIGFVFRRIEGALLKRCRRLVVSSPAFLRNYFEKHHAGRYRASLIENRIAAGADYGPRPAPTAPASPAAPLRLGWVGVLRCARSLDLLLALAERFGDRVRIVMHGQPALTEIPDFHARIANRANVAFHGRYKAPEDLARIYGELDVVWAGDFMEAGFNSVWLLPNRLYEGGYYAVPPIAPAGTETAAWIDQRGIGFTAAEDLAVTLPALIDGLIADRGSISSRRTALLALPDDAFIQPRGALAEIIAQALASGPLRGEPAPSLPGQSQLKSETP
jgi:succinoglycan biosynthesis protein ExoL